MMKRLALALVFVLVVLCAAQSQEKPIDGFGVGAGDIHLINDVAFKSSSNRFNVFVEIPVGTWEKWGVGKKDGRLHQQFKKGQPHEIMFLAYPANYGFIPQTTLSKKNNGEGGALDVFLLDSSPHRGEVVEVRIIGGFDYNDDGTKDYKLLAVTSDGPFRKIKDLADLFLTRPGSVEILKLWVDNFKGPGTMHFIGYLTRSDAEHLIEKSHKEWLLQFETTNEL